jgi:hypothetical protein
VLEAILLIVAICLPLSLTSWLWYGLRPVPDLSAQEREIRSDLWLALSDLFLDDDVDEVSIEHIARVVRRSGYSPSAVRRIYWREVLPAVGMNMYSVAGAWGGFERAWLDERVLARKAWVQPLLWVFIWPAGLMAYGDLRRAIRAAGHVSNEC